MPAPFVIEVLDRTFTRVAFVGAPLAVTLTPRHNALTTCELTVSNDAPQAPYLLAEGARLRVSYGGQTYTGPVRSVAGSGPISAGTLTFRMDDDFRLLSRMLAWPTPTNPVTGQSKEYDVRSGPAETVAKGLLKVNADRLGIPLTVQGDLGRGSKIRVDARMHPAADLLLPAVDAAGIGLRVVQDGPRYTLSAYVPKTYTRTLTERSGIVAAWEVSREAPTATRVVVGGGGEGVKRLFIDRRNAPLETQWNDLIEVFRDADDAASDYNSARQERYQAYDDLQDREQDVKDADKDWRLAKLENVGVADALTALNNAKAARDKAAGILTVAEGHETLEKVAYLSELEQRAAETLAEGAPRSGVKVTLSETASFRYGADGLLVGDRVRIEVGPGLVVDEVLREAVISWTADAGLTVVPVVGEISDSPSKALVQAVSKLGARVRALLARR